MDKEIKICPKCGSTHVGVNVTEGGRYNVCQDCGYGQPGTFVRKLIAGEFPSIKKSDLKRFQEEIKKNST